MTDDRPPGWYPDPFGTSPEDRRYWDGETWLATTPAPTASAPVSEAPSTEGWREPAGADDRWRDREVTPDGVRLASWGRRFGAYLVDVVLLGIVSMVLAVPLGVWDAVGAFVEQLQGVTSQAEITNLQLAFMSEHAGRFALLSTLGLVVSAAYHIGLVATRGATPGKLALGIAVRLREREGAPGWQAATVRWLVFFGPGLLGSVPLLSYAATTFQLLDGLWPLWDARRQAIHDKLALTNVVVRRG